MPAKPLSLLAALMAAAAFMQIDAASAPAEAACVVGVPSWDTLNMRAGPSARYRIVAAIPAQACGVRIFWSSCRGNWCKVRYAGRRGWVNMRYIRESGNAPGILGRACVAGVLPGDKLNMRAGPSARYRRIGALPHNECGITVFDQCRGSWCKVANWAGFRGWVNTRYLRYVD